MAEKAYRPIDGSFAFSGLGGSQMQGADRLVAAKLQGGGQWEIAQPCAFR